MAKNSVTTIMLFLAGWLLAGCAAHQPQSELNVKGMLRSYMVDVKKADGIDIDEALLMARCEIIFRDAFSDFDMKYPQVYKWHDKGWVVRFDGSRKTLKEAMEKRYALVFVDSSNGHVEWQEGKEGPKPAQEAF